LAHAVAFPRLHVRRAVHVLSDGFAYDEGAVRRSPAAARAKSPASASTWVSALKRALSTRRPPPGLVHHTDRGCRYASAAYQAVWRDHEATCSMSRAGDCDDNAVALSIFASLKKECLHRHVFATRTEVYDALAAYIDGFYNPVRRHSSTGYLSPIDHERPGQLAHAV
jgi:transposase InsO family protein